MTWLPQEVVLWKALQVQMMLLKALQITFERIHSFLSHLSVYGNEVRHAL